MQHFLQHFASVQLAESVIEALQRVAQLRTHDVCVEIRGEPDRRVPQHLIHPEVPEAVVVVAAGSDGRARDGLKLGHFAASRWHVAARIVCHARRMRLRIDATWPWADQLVTAFARIRALPLLT